MNSPVIALHERAGAIATIRSRLLLLRAEADRAITIFPDGPVRRWLVSIRDRAIDHIDDADKILELFKET